MQRTVVAQLQKGLSDPLAEAETLAQLDGFLSEQGVPEEERSRCGGVRPDVPRAPEELARQDEELEVSEAPTPYEVPAQVGPEHEGRQGEALVCDVHRMSVLGKSPKETRNQDSSRARTWLQHFPLRQEESQVLAPAHLLPGVDSMDYTFAGNAMPKRAEYDGVCRLCALTVCVRERTRPRRCPPRPRLRVPPELKSALLPKSIPSVAAAILRVSVRDRPWQCESTSPYDSPIQCTTTVPLMVVPFGVFLFAFLAWRVASVCVVCGVRVVSVLVPFAGPCLCLVRCWCGAGARDGGLAGSSAGVGPVGGPSAGRFSGPVFGSWRRFSEVFCFR